MSLLSLARIAFALLDQFADRAETSRPEELFEALESLCKALVRVELFTCSRFDLDAGQAERIYSSDPAAYPLSGIKDVVQGDFGLTTFYPEVPYMLSANTAWLAMDTMEPPLDDPEFGRDLGGIQGP